MRTIRRQVSVVIGLKGTFRRMPQRCRREPYHAPGDKTKSLAGDGSSEALRPKPQSLPRGQDRRFVGLAVLGSLLSRRSRRRQTTVVVRSHDALSGWVDTVKLKMARRRKIFERRPRDLRRHDLEVGDDPRRSIFPSSQCSRIP
jgi:hypothetical protein